MNILDMSAEDLTEGDAFKLTKFINGVRTLFFSEGYSMEYIENGQWKINDAVVRNAFDMGYFPDLIKKWGKLIGNVIS